jgi:hypothetical protein
LFVWPRCLPAPLSCCLPTGGPEAPAFETVLVWKTGRVPRVAGGVPRRAGGVPRSCTNVAKHETDRSCRGWTSILGSMHEFAPENESHSGFAGVSASPCCASPPSMISRAGSVRVQVKHWDGAVNLAAAHRQSTVAAPAAVPVRRRTGGASLSVQIRPRRGWGGSVFRRRADGLHSTDRPRATAVDKAVGVNLTAAAELKRRSHPHRTVNLALENLSATCLASVPRGQRQNCTALGQK